MIGARGPAASGSRAASALAKFSSHAAQLYDRTGEEVTLDEVERIAI
jgi:hypothetical protein